MPQVRQGRFWFVYSNGAVEPERQEKWPTILKSFRTFQGEFFRCSTSPADECEDFDAAREVLLLCMGKISPDASDGSDYERSDGSASECSDDESAGAPEDADQLDDGMSIADKLVEDSGRDLDEILSESLGAMFSEHRAEFLKRQSTTASVVRAMEEGSVMQDADAAMAHVFAAAAGINCGDDCTDSESDDGDDDTGFEFYSSAEEHVAAAISPEQKKYITKYIQLHPQLSSWPSPVIQKPSPLFSGSGLDSSKPESWLLLETFFCSPTQQLQHIGVGELPCPNCGDMGLNPFHGDITISNELRTRRVRGISSDYCLAGWRFICNRCARKRAEARKTFAAARSAGACPSRLATLEAAVKSSPSGRFTTFDAKVLVRLAQRHPFLYFWVPAFVTHKAAVALELLSLLM